MKTHYETMFITILFMLAGDVKHSIVCRLSILMSSSFFHLYHLARSANLPEGLYILPMFFLYFFFIFF